MALALRSRPLAVVALFAWLAGLACSRDRKASPAASSADPLVVAATVLNAYRAHDWPTLASLMQPSVRATQTGLAQQIAANFTSWRASSIERWDGSPPTDVRFAHYKGPHAEATEAVIPYGEAGPGELAAIRLVRERGTWWFGRLISPSPERYQAMAATLDEAMRRQAASGAAP